MSGTSELDGPVDVFVVAEEPGTGLGARCAGIDRSDPGREVGDGQPTCGSGSTASRCRCGRSPPVAADAESDRSVFAGEADGRWLWLVLRPASAMLLLRDDWILRDVSGPGSAAGGDALRGARAPAW